MKTRYFLFLSLLILSACANMNNHHPFNAVPLKANEITTGVGIGSANNIFSLGTFSPDSVNIHIQSDIEKSKFIEAGIPGYLRAGLGRGYSVATQLSAGMTSGMNRCPLDGSFTLTERVQAKAYLTKSFVLAEDFYLAFSPADSISRGVGHPGISYSIDYSHKGIEVPITISYEWQNPFNKKDKPVDLVFSGTVRGARDYFKGDVNLCGPEAFETTWYIHQPKNVIDRYAAMAHIDIEHISFLNISAQYGREYGKGRDYNKAWPIFYLGFETRLKGKNK